MMKVSVVAALLAICTIGCAAQQKATAPVTITVNPALLVITPPNLPAGQAGVAYTATGGGPVALTATGGTAPYTWAVTAGALPGGVLLSSAGVFSGTPTAAGSFSFTVTCTDSASSSVAMKVEFKPEAKAASPPSR
jgi:hypothetical protein